jgi:hypothetical protein
MEKLNCIFTSSGIVKRGCMEEDEMGATACVEEMRNGCKILV